MTQHNEIWKTNRRVGERPTTKKNEQKEVLEKQN